MIARIQAPHQPYRKPHSANPATFVTRFRLVTKGSSMDRTAIEAERARLYNRLTNRPHPYEHGALYAAQQALAWVLNPDLAAAPLDAIARSQAAHRDCCRTGRPETSEQTCAPSQDASSLQVELPKEVR